MYGKVFRTYAFLPVHKFKSNSNYTMKLVVLGTVSINPFLIDFLNLIQEGAAMPHPLQNFVG